MGDWHSTQKSGDGDVGERAGRWAGKGEKTECGLHSDYFALKAAAKKKVSTSPLRIIVLGGLYLTCSLKHRLLYSLKARTIHRTLSLHPIVLRYYLGYR